MEGGRINRNVCVYVRVCVSVYVRGSLCVCVYAVLRCVVLCWFYRAGYSEVTASLDITPDAEIRLCNYGPRGQAIILLDIFFVFVCV